MRLVPYLIQTSKLYYLPNLIYRCQTPRPVATRVLTEIPIDDGVLEVCPQWDVEAKFLFRIR